MADLPSGRKPLPDMHYASGRDPTMKRTCPAFPRSGCRLYFANFTKT